jgi:hypothetical protein
MFLKAVVVGLFEAVAGRDMFPANPKGPLYKWFGKPKDGQPEPTTQKLIAPDQR